MTAPSPVQLALIQNRLDEIARQMATVMVRTARSTVLSLSHDFSCFVSDADGAIISQADGCPIHTGCGGLSVKALLAAFPDDVNEGDVFLMNDPYVAGGNHLADWVVVHPAFHDEQRIGFTCNRAHQSDIGGGAAGTFNPKATEIWHEGIRLPPLKLYRRGEVCEDLWQLLLLNCRTPDLIDGDLRAMVGSTEIGKDRLEAIARDLGVDQAHACFRGILDHGERMARACIADLPDGTYHGQDWTLNDCFEDIATPVRVAITVSCDSVHVDFEGTGPQMKGFKNSSAANTQSAVYMAIKSFFDAPLPHNEGVFRPISIAMPLGSAVNPRSPAPTSNGTIVIAQHIIHAVWQALGQADPDLACAGWGRSVHPTMSGHTPETDHRYIVFHFQTMPGGGALKGRDGFASVGHLSALGGLTIPNIEPYEQLYPITFERQELRCDAGGPGEYRGGPGIDYAVTMKEPCTMHFRSEGIGPASGFGAKSGGEGEGGFMEVTETSGDHDIPPPFSTRHYGPCTYHALSPGGGGWGDPLHRSVERVRDDVQGGIVSREKARETYGVVILEGGRTVDAKSTARLRGHTIIGQ